MNTMTDQVRTDLSDLVRDRRAELRLSLRAVEARTADETGESAIKYGWLNKLEKGQDITPPRLRELRALAAGLDLPLGRIQDAAAAQFLGIQSEWSASGDARALVEQAERLTPEQREAVRGLIETLTDKSGT